MAQARIELFRVLPETLTHAWPTVAPMLQEALQYGIGEYDLADMWQETMQGNMQMWVAVDKRMHAIRGVALTELVTHPRKTVCRVIALGGDKGQLEAILQLQEEIEDWALSQDATVIEAIVRPGMMRKLRERGFSQQRYVVAKDLSKRLH